jgi:hypothetical protein
MNEASPNFTDISDLLFWIASCDKELGDEATSSLGPGGHRDGYAEALRQRARLIADLPIALAVYREVGGVVPEEVEDFARGYSRMANGALDQDNTFGMGVLLIHESVRLDEANDLERLAMRFRPSHDVNV